MNAALHRVQLAAVGEAFNRCNLLAFGGGGEGQAGVHALAVDMHRARAALAMVAAFFAAGQADMLAERVEKRRARVEVQLVIDAVDVERVRPGLETTEVPGSAKSDARKRARALRFGGLGRAHRQRGDKCRGDGGGQKLAAGQRQLRGLRLSPRQSWRTRYALRRCRARPLSTLPAELPGAGPARPAERRSASGRCRPRR